MEKLNRALLAEVKRAFVAMPGGNPGPVAGGGMLTQAQAAPMGDPSAGGAPMDPAAMGGDPSAMGGMPMDPSMMGGAPAGGVPMDPSAGGGMPPADPSMGAVDPNSLAGAMVNSAPASGTITMTVQDLIAIIQSVQAPAKGKSKPTVEGAAPAGAAPQGGDSSSAKLDQILQMLGGGQSQPMVQ